MMVPKIQVLELDKIERTFHQGGKALNILKGASLSVAPGEIVGLLGPSGSGKSTLLHVAGLLEAPDGGSVSIEGADCKTLSDRERTLKRRSRVGFVYQFHHLLPEFDALENVVMPLRIANMPADEARASAYSLLGRMGLRDRLTHLPAELSGGEQQRVAIARALANKPALLLADEPTGNLDESTAARVFDVLVKVVRDTGAGALIATHNLALADRMDRCLYLHEGILSEKSS